MKLFTRSKPITHRLLSVIACLTILASLTTVNLAYADISPQPGYGDNGQPNWEDGRYALFFQTTGNANTCSDGNWLTCGNGVGGDHFYELVIPCDWPNNVDFHIDILSPYYTRADLDGTTTIDSLDEYNGANPTPIDQTQFVLYGSDTYTLDMFGATQITTDTAPIVNSTFMTETTRDHEWVRFATIPGANVASVCGTLLLHEIVSWNTDARNGWALRTGYDDNADPNDTPPADFASPNGATSGTPIFPIGFEPETGGPRDGVTEGTFCSNFFYESDASQPAVSFYFFDLDFRATINYYDPSGVNVGTEDLNVNGIENNGEWNGNGTDAERATTDMSTILASEWDGVSPQSGIGRHFINTMSGFWRIEACFSSEDHFYFSGPFGDPIYNSECCTPTAVTLQTVEAETLASNYVIILSATLLLMLTIRLGRTVQSYKLAVFTKSKLQASNYNKDASRNKFWNCWVLTKGSWVSKLKGDFRNEP